MATVCSRCGKKLGIFASQSTDGLCVPCQVEVNTAKDVKKDLTPPQNYSVPKQVATPQTTTNRTPIIGQPERKGILDVFGSSEVKKENERLRALIEQIGASDAIGVQNHIEQLRAEENNYVARNIEILKEIEKAETLLSEKEAGLISIDDTLLLESFALYKPHFAFQDSAEYKARLDDVREKQKAMIREKTAATGSQTWKVNNSLTEGRKLVNDMTKLVLRSFNNECDYCVDNVKFHNFDRMVKRITTSYDALNKLGKTMSVSISGGYMNLKYDELVLAFEYQQKKEEEKEILRQKREEMREQAKLEQEIKAARDRIAKEKKHFASAIEDLQNRIGKTSDPDQLKDLEQKVSQLKEQSGKLDEEERLIDYRVQNAKAGYVYIISNIGAFGEGIYKIGMTRRLEPLDRIAELGDASVPFPFDVHALVFSENAPDLEAKIQQHFHAFRLNKINNRKEFFRADINEIEHVVRTNYDKVLNLVKDCQAEQYRESLLL